MPNYLNSKIYKLCCKDLNVKDIYIGSTSQLLCKRKSAHKNSCTDEYNSKKYNIIGLRQGEKISEILLSESEKKRSITKSNMWIINPY